MRISDWSSDVCSSDLARPDEAGQASASRRHRAPTADVERDFGDGGGGVFLLHLVALKIFVAVWHQQQHQILKSRIVADQEQRVGAIGGGANHFEQEIGRAHV